MSQPWADLPRQLTELAVSVGASEGALGVITQGRATVKLYGPAGEHTAFELGSITKTATALLLADMVHRREVRYDDPISAYLPASAVPTDARAARITLIQLATHSGGFTGLLPNVPLLPEGERDNFLDSGFNPYADYQLTDLYRATATLQLAYTPGEKVVYSNFGAGLLGHLLSNASGRGWSQLLEQRICQPLGMRDAVTEPAPHCAIGHRNGRPIPPYAMATLSAAGMLRSSPADMVHYVRAQLDPDATPLASALRETHQPRLPIGGRESQCLGWKHRRFQFGDVLFHSGGTLGMTTFAGFCPQTGTAVFALVNSRATDGPLQTPYDLLKHLGRQAHQHTSPKPT